MMDQKDPPASTVDHVATALSVTPRSQSNRRGGGSATETPDRAPIAEAPPATRASRPPGKLGDLLKAIDRKQGATLAALSASLGWQPHTVRAAISRLRKRG